MASPSRSQTLPMSPGSASASRFSTRKSTSTDPGWKRLSGALNTRDELLMSLMASEAVIDSRDFEILSAEEVEELKKVRLFIFFSENAYQQVTYRNTKF